RPGHAAAHLCGLDLAVRAGARGRTCRLRSVPRAPPARTRGRDVGGGARLRRVRPDGLEIARLDDRELIEADVPAERGIDLVRGQCLELRIQLVVPGKRSPE